MLKVGRGGMTAAKNAADNRGRRLRQALRPLERGQRHSGRGGEGREEKAREPDQARTVAKLRSSARRTVSYAKVEKVVYAPQKPVPSTVFGVAGKA